MSYSSLALALLTVACTTTDPSTTEGPARRSADGRDAPLGDPSMPLADAAAGDYRWLSETGLYARGASGDLAEGVRPYAPRFELWADGADKRRFIALPAGTAIDASNVDDWTFPVGTKIWKEFSREGQLLETRLIEKRSDEYLGWYMRAFVWNAEGTDAEVTPDGALDVLGTTHDVPSKQDCRDCHFGRRDRVLGVSALQLADEGDVATLSEWVDAEIVSPSIQVELPLPGDGVDRAALGYLHANCGHCHVEGGRAWEMTGLQLHLGTDTLGSVEGTPAYVSAVGVEVQKDFGNGVSVRIVPGSPESSAVVRRMSTRDEEEGMPNLGTEEVDDLGLELVRSWIERLE